MLLGTVSRASPRNRRVKNLKKSSVTGLRGSLIASMNIKREPVGVVDAISAEDIGKFPDTQPRGVTATHHRRIDRPRRRRRSRVTARGFGPDSTWSRSTAARCQPPTSSVVGSGDDGEFGTFTSRSFDFSNLASEGVTGLEVYKTGVPSKPSGGIGATIDVGNHAAADDGQQGSLGAKAMFDTSVETGNEVTPEVTGLYSWANDAESFGVALFGSYQQRDSASVGAGNQDWNVERLDGVPEPGQRPCATADDPATPASTRRRRSTTCHRQSAGGRIPNNSDCFFSEIERERINGQAVSTIPASGYVHGHRGLLFAQNENDERAVPRRATGSTSGFAQSISTRRTRQWHDILSRIRERARRTSPGASSCARRGPLESIGLNLRLGNQRQLRPRVRRAHVGGEESDPNGPNGQTSYDFGTGAACDHRAKLDLSSGFPVQEYTYDDRT